MEEERNLQIKQSNDLLLPINEAFLNKTAFDVNYTIYIN